jgi:hypothetical protein
VYGVNPLLIDNSFLKTYVLVLCVSSCEQGCHADDNGRTDDGGGGVRDLDAL